MNQRPTFSDSPQSNPYAPPATATASGRADDAGKMMVTFIAGCVFYAALGSLFVAGMYAADFQGETAILMAMACVLLVIAVVAPVLRLRACLPAYILFPFCLHVLGNFCGDMGRVHMFDSIPFTLAMLLLFVVVSCSTAWKLLALASAHPPTSKREETDSH